MEAVKNHVEEAYRLLTGEVYRGTAPDDMERQEGICTIVLDLNRIDCAIGPRGQSIFARIADNIQAAYVEISAAKEAVQS